MVVRGGLGRPAGRGLRPASTPRPFSGPLNRASVEPRGSQSTCASLSGIRKPKTLRVASEGFNGGERWIRTTVERSSADLQSALVGHLSISP